MNKLLKLSLLSVCVLSLWACTKEATSDQPKYVFKSAPKDGLVAKIDGKEISEVALYSGIEADIYEAEVKLYEIKMNKIRAMMLEVFMNNDSRKKGLSNDEFLDKYIAKDIKVSEKDIESFIKERQIPASNINAQMTERIKNYLQVEKKRQAVDKWIAKKTASNPVEVYIDKPTRPTFDVSVGDAPVFGPESAPVTIIEFSDFQCPFCAKGATVVEEIKQKYGNKVRVAFKNFPLPFHNQAKGAAMAALCAHDQEEGKFWEMHDKLFANQEKLMEQDLHDYAKEIELDMDSFKECLAAQKFASQIDSSIQEGQEVGVKSTPTFYVNGILVNGAQPLEAFSEIIDEQLGQ
jgi:protein-disulfide isomerase